MNVTGQVESTPRSKTMTGRPFRQAASTAGVSVAVVFGDTMSASHPLPSRSLMSAICFWSLPSASTWTNCLIRLFCASTSACMVLKPTCRHGLFRPALEKQILYGPGFLNFAVSTIVGLSTCSHGLSAGPVGVAFEQRELLVVVGLHEELRLLPGAGPGGPGRGARCGGGRFVGGAAGEHQQRTDRKDGYGRSH